MFAHIKALCRTP